MVAAPRLEEDAEEADEDEGGEDGYPEAEPQPDREDDAEVRAPHHERALGEVDDVEDREGDGEADGDERVQAPERQCVHRLLQEHGADGSGGPRPAQPEGSSPVAPSPSPRPCPAALVS
jgi:hypothetical protein